MGWARDGRPDVEHGLEMQGSTCCRNSVFDTRHKHRLFGSTWVLTDIELVMELYECTISLNERLDSSFCALLVLGF